MNANVAANAYRSVKRAGITEGSTPHRLIAQLLEGAANSITALIDSGEGNQQLTHHYTSKSIDIINELQACLHEPDTNEIAGNLYMLYSFMVEQLLMYRRHDPSANLPVCVQILEGLQDTWAQIEPGRDVT